MKENAVDSPQNGDWNESLSEASDSGLFSSAERQHLDSFLDEIDSVAATAHDKVTNSSKTSVRLIAPRQSNALEGDNHVERPSPRKRSRLDMAPSEQRKSRAVDDLGKPKGAGRGRKPSHELLTEDQKKANHIASEQKRRANIRIGFEKLVDAVPGLNGGHRSESQILQKSTDYIRQLLDTKESLTRHVRELQAMLGEVSDDDNSDDAFETL